MARRSVANTPAAQANLDAERAPIEMPVPRRVRVAEGTQVNAAGKLHAGGEVFRVPAEVPDDEIREWVLSGWVTGA